MRPYLFWLLIPVLFGCSGKTKASLQNTSPDGQVKISVEASRNSSVESWKVDLKVKSHQFKEGKLAFEVYAEDLTPENVSFEWKDNTHCSIRFRQSDGEIRKFELIATGQQLELAEM